MKKIISIFLVTILIVLFETNAIKAHENLKISSNDDLIIKSIIKEVADGWEKSKYFNYQSSSIFDAVAINVYKG